MSTTNEIQTLFLELLKDGEIHSIEEITNIAIEHNIIGPERKGLVRSAVAYLKKKNPNIVMLERGKYRMVLRDGVSENNTVNGTDNDTKETKKSVCNPDNIGKAYKSAEMKKAIKVIRNYLAWCRSPFWMTLSNEKLEMVKHNYEELVEIAEEVLKLRMILSRT